LVRYFKLDKVFKAGGSYRCEDDKFYLVDEWGTDATSDIYFTYDRWSSPPIYDDVAPLRKTTSNLLGPMKLADRYWVLPPKVPFDIVGPTGKFLRFIGRIGVLAPGEVLPSTHAARYEAQPKSYRRYWEYKYGHGTDKTWADGAEVVVASLTPTMRERFTLNSILMLAVENITVGDGDAGLVFRKDTERFDIVNTKMGMLGIDTVACPKPPASTNMVPFTLEDMPIVVEKEETLYFIIRNQSGATWTPAAGTEIKWTVTFICDYDLIGGKL